MTRLLLQRARFLPPQLKGKEGVDWVKDWAESLAFPNLPGGL